MTSPNGATENTALVLDLTKLEKLRLRGGKTIGRCPACAEGGGNRKGEHLFIAKNAQFGNKAIRHIRIAREQIDEFVRNV